MSSGIIAEDLNLRIELSKKGPLSRRRIIRGDNSPPKKVYNQRGRGRDRGASLSSNALPSAGYRKTLFLPEEPVEGGREYTRRPDEESLGV